MNCQKFPICLGTTWLGFSQDGLTLYLRSQCVFLHPPEFNANCSANSFWIREPHELIGVKPNFCLILEKTHMVMKALAVRAVCQVKQHQFSCFEKLHTKTQRSFTAERGTACSGQFIVAFLWTTSYCQDVTIVQTACCCGVVWQRFIMADPRIENRNWWPR